MKWIGWIFHEDGVWWFQTRNPDTGEKTRVHKNTDAEILAYVEQLAGQRVILLPTVAGFRVGLDPDVAPSATKEQA